MPGQNFLAQFVPSLAEFTLPFGNPLLGHMVRGMSGAGGIIDKKGFIRRQGLLILDPRHCLVGHVFQEMIIGIIRQFNLVSAVINKRCPLVGFAAKKSVELFKSLTGRPTDKWP